jgi:hypothetical protein
VRAAKSGGEFKKYTTRSCTAETYHIKGNDRRANTSKMVNRGMQIGF